MSNLEKKDSFDYLLKEEVTKISQGILDQEIKIYQYDNLSNAQKKSNTICDTILIKLKDLNNNKQFKFIVSCLILQKADYIINLSASCYWDNNTDGSVAIRQESENTVAIVNIFALGV
ncbi:unnamed protein product (macronuclear) [Paramecium tetraurelia]|uniref:Dynein light chain n=1 Tax=Paramecium tetraurelia TaxID=5888 RepID=A0DT14_PARTE|nr:uncharacterized protein GSPATT00019874001 [Paramecium tetraurelia]CAK86181.1 unnamed protein product [Paramecium tetraurelia]|eukprot:XP_001453578.1 hypothetical protein (macronuclear) [Paramecium tetraurelia strain d4-2]